MQFPCQNLNVSIDPSLRDLVAKLMPLTVSLLTVNSYIERRSTFQYGRVSHALCAAIRDILKVCILT